MIPVIPVRPARIVNQAEQPSRTYYFDRDTGRVAGHTDGLEAMRQAVYKVLATERYRHEIYSPQYGAEFADLSGQSMAYVKQELERRITEALKADARVISVEAFRFEQEKNRLKCQFTVKTTLGVFEAVKEVKS